jgi:hypothetical protein
MSMNDPRRRPGQGGSGSRRERTAGDIVDALNDNTAVEVAALRTEIAEMRTMVAAVIGLDQMTVVLENGFGTLSDQLRQLVPATIQRPLERPVDRALVSLRASLQPTDFDDTGRLAVTYTNVPYIGAVDVAQRKQKGTP